MKLMLRYLSPFALRAYVGLAIKSLSTLAELIIPYILSYIVDTAVAYEDIGVILLWGGVMISAATVGVTGNIIANRMAAKVAMLAAKNLRHDLFEKTLLLSGRQSDAFTVPSLESRLTTDTYNIHSFLGIMQRMGVRAPILLIGGIAVTLVLDARLALVMISVLPFISASVLIVSLRGIPLYTRVQKSVDAMIRVVREDAAGIRVIKALSKTEHEKERYDRANRRLVEDEKTAGTVMAATNPLITLFLNAGLILVIIVGALLVRDGYSKPGKIIAFMQYFTLISMAMMSVTRIFVMYTKSAASAVRIDEVLAAADDLPVADTADYPPAETDSFISFNNVSFSYNGVRDDLSDISFSVRRGGSVGIIGATGSGKSTLARLLMRLYDADHGAVYIGGKDVRTIPTAELRSTFGAALQNDFICAGTIRENIDFGRGLDDGALLRAADLAQAKEFIDGFPDGMEHLLTAKGTNLSGGQRQRLFIARALAACPDILILDDSSSALDYRTDANLRKAISSGLGDTTSVIIAQRVSSVMGCDLILVLDAGRIIGAGSHSELLESCEIYGEISRSQMGGLILE